MSDIPATRPSPTLPPPGEGPGVEVAPALRPSWRGVIHLVSVLVYLPLFGLLLVLAPSAHHRLAMAVYAAGVVAMLGVSATYHSGRLAPATVRWMKRVDHSTILLAIAGSYTAIAVLALPGEASGLVWFTWIAAAVGAAIRMAWLTAPYPVVAAVYVVVGWGALFEWSALSTALDLIQMALLVGGGLVYTAGAVVYALHRPDPWPATFGYHEVFHALVATGVTLHFVLVLDLLLAAR